MAEKMNGFGERFASELYAPSGLDKFQRTLRYSGLDIALSRNQLLPWVIEPAAFYASALWFNYQKAWLNESEEGARYRSNLARKDVALRHIHAGSLLRPLINHSIETPDQRNDPLTDQIAMLVDVGVHVPYMGAKLAEARLLHDLEAAKVLPIVTNPNPYRNGPEDSLIWDWWAERPHEYQQYLTAMNWREKVMRYLFTGVMIADRVKSIG